jgi:hypothetical protein
MSNYNKKLDDLWNDLKTNLPEVNFDSENDNDNEETNDLENLTSIKVSFYFC